VTNGLQDVALAFEPGEPGLLERAPRAAAEGLVTWRIMQRLAAVGAVLAAGTLAMFWWALSTTHEESEGGVGQTTLDLNVSFISGVSEGDVIAEGRILRRGRSIAFGEATITDGDGKLVAVGRATYMIVAGRS